MNQELRILMLEDSAIDAELIERELRDARLVFRCERVASKATFLSTIGTFKPDVILSDNSLPGFDAPAALEIVQSVCPHVPLIVVSGTMGEEAAVEMLKKGATDYVLKGRMERLAHVVKRALREVEEQKERRKAEENYRSIFENASVGIYQTTPGGHFITANPAMARILGYDSPQELVATVTDIRNQVYVDPLRRDQLAALLKSDGVAKNFEVEMYRKTGRVIWVSSNSRAICDESGKLVFYETFTQDITKRKMANDQLRKLYRAVEQCPVSIVITDITGAIEYVNPKFEDLTGYLVEEVIGKNPSILKSENTAPEEYERLWKTIKAGDEWRGEFQNKKKNGDFFWKSATISPIKNDQGEITHFLAVKEDITERKEMEANLLRTQRLESIGMLASGIAHDLNNILAPILMGASMLRGKLPAETHEMLAINIEACAKRGVDIVKQVLTFGRGAENERTPMQLGTLIHEIAYIADETFSKSITIKTSLPKGLWEIVGDATQLHQVLLNLYINARDAMPHGGELFLIARNVDVDAHYAVMLHLANPGRYVVIAVSDTGAGIPKQLLEKIFDPFFTTKEVGKGTGLGLSTVAAIVKAHEGFINVQSEVGKGTTFEIFLPASSGSELLPAVPVEAMPAGSGQLVLVVDDEASIRTVVQAILESHGYNVLIAADGADALAIYAQHRGKVDVVLTDMMMPFVDGVTLAKALRKMSPELKIIASTGQADKSRMAELKSLRIDAFLTKPYTSESLLITLNEALSATMK